MNVRERRLQSDVSVLIANEQACGHHIQYWNGHYCERCSELADQHDFMVETERALRRSNDKLKNAGPRTPDVRES